MKRFYETKDYSYAALVSNYKKFIVPNFQRSYKWKNKQVTEFFSAIDQGEEGYFIGNMVCVVPHKNNENRLIIVDGQQRITTITLLLIALRDYSRENFDSTEEEVEWINDYLKDRDKKERKDYYILKARKKTYNDVLEDLVNGHRSGKYDKAQRAYINSYNILKKLIQDKVAGNEKKLNDFVTKVFELQIVAIVLNSEKDIFNAFEGLNSKGLGLSVSDQIKNFLFGHAEKLNCVDDVESIWNEIESDFEKENPELVTKFLRHLWISKNKYISGSDLYDALKKDIEQNKTKASLLKYVEDLSVNSKYYLGIKSDNFKHYLNDLDHEVLEILTKFKYIDNQQVFEILLALYQKQLKTKTFKPKYFRDIASTLWNFCLRTKFLIINPSKYERKFAEYCQLIKNTDSEKIINVSKDFFDTLRKLTNDKDSFVVSMSEDMEYNSSDAKLIRLLLSEIIEKHDKNAITFKEVSIEHIVPQEPKEWGLSKKDVSEYVHSLGNLTLLHPKDNQKAQNKTMQKKCSEIYEVSHFKFNRQISEKYKQLFVDDYREAIKQRGKDISTEVYDITKI